MHKKYTLILYLLLVNFLQAQDVIKKDTITRNAIIDYQLNDNELFLFSDTPELIQISGAPKAFYSYFWEFGDGNFSKEKTPKHTYKEKGDYEVKLWVTNHYDNGKPPATRPQKVAVKALSKPSVTVASMSDDLELLINRDPVPEEEMVLVLRYKNSKEYVTNGRLYLFYNEKKYKNNNFDVKDIRFYNGEELIVEDENTLAYSNQVDDNAILYASLTNTVTQGVFQEQDSTRTDLVKTLQESKEYYKNSSILNFYNQNSQEERNVFFTMKTPPEMLKDTSAIITIRSVFVPDTNYQNHKVKEQEMEIVTSHDPNKMSSNGTFLNYRLVRYKTLKYKIQFQNDGEGPASTIRLETDIPEMLDKATLEVVAMYPKCKICPKEPVNYSCLDTTYTKEQAIFTFKNIYLPGTNQKGIQEKDSTKGFVKYKIKFSKDFHKKKTVSKTAIIFDKNEPIITNTSATRFLPGISIGAKAGYNYYPNLTNSKSYFAGATVSPFKSYRWYWQVELLTSLHTFNDVGIDEVIEGQPNQDVRRLIRTTTSLDYNNIDLEVPLLVRYNINNYIGLGAGIQGKLSVRGDSNSTTTIDLVDRFIDGNDVLVRSSSVVNEAQKSPTNFRKGFLVEATAGFARIGPSVGARYVFDTQKENNYWQIYAIWKF